MTTDTFIGPYSGFKIVEYFGVGDKRVVSPYRNQHKWWPHRTSPKAKCELQSGQMGFEHPSPAMRCQCGYYAYVEFDEARNAQQLFRGVVPMNFEFVVLVSGWGRLITHEIGFRSEYMEIAALHKGYYQHSDRIQQVAEDMGLPYLTKNEMEDYAHECGIVLTPETLP